MSRGGPIRREDLERAYRQGAESDRISVAPPLCMEDGPGGKSIWLDLPDYPILAVIKGTAYSADSGSTYGYGWYEVVALHGPPSAGGTSWLAGGGYTAKEGGRSGQWDAGGLSCPAYDYSGRRDINAGGNAASLAGPVWLYPLPFAVDDAADGYRDLRYVFAFPDGIFPAQITGTSAGSYSWVEVYFYTDSGSIAVGVKSAGRTGTAAGSHAAINMVNAGATAPGVPNNTIVWMWRSVDTGYYAFLYGGIGAPGSALDVDVVTDVSCVDDVATATVQTLSGVVVIGGVDYPVRFTLT